MTRIVFDTDGWHAIMGRDFTFYNVRVVAQAIANYLRDHVLDERGTVVGWGGICRVVLRLFPDDSRNCARDYPHRYR